MRDDIPEISCTLALLVYLLAVFSAIAFLFYAGLI